MSFWDDCVDETCFVALPRVGASPEQDNSCFLDADSVLKCPNCSADSSCVAAHDARRTTVEILFIIALGDKGRSRYLVFLAALKNRLDSDLVVHGLVFCTQS